MALTCSFSMRFFPPGSSWSHLFKNFIGWHWNCSFLIRLSFVWLKSLLRKLTKWKASFLGVWNSLYLDICPPRVNWCLWKACKFHVEFVRISRKCWWWQSHGSMYITFQTPSKGWLQHFSPPMGYLHPVTARMGLGKRYQAAPLCAYCAVPWIKSWLD